MSNFFYIYFLYSYAFNKTYIGQTNNITERLKRHNKGQVQSTKRYKPWTVVYFEQLNTRSEAMKKERWFKSGKGRKTIQVLIREKQGIASR